MKWRRFLEAARDAGATTAGYVLLRLPLEIKDLFREWLETHEPTRAGRVISLIQDCRNGRDYDPAWRQRQIGTGPFADMISRRFALATRKLGLSRRPWEFDTGQFIRPTADSDQLALL